MAKFRLWTPVANALEAYRRRFIANPTALYEHVWRLIQIEEALVVTLGSLLTSRLIALWESSPENRDLLNHLRMLVTGIRATGDADTGSDHRLQGCLPEGSIGAWTDLLNRFSSEEANCPFFRALSTYLKDEAAGEGVAFVEPWQRIGPVPETFRMTKMRIGHLQAINSLRNKLAHVPLSERILKHLFRGLRKEVLMLLTPEAGVIDSDISQDVFTRKWHPPLAGRIESGSGYVDGSDFGKLERDCCDGVRFAWVSEDETVVRWDAAPFIRCDEEFKVLVLFRLIGLEEDLDDSPLRGEYYRFAAEIEPVQEGEVEVEVVRKLIPDRPQAAGDGTPESSSTATTPPESLATVEVLAQPSSGLDSTLTNLPASELRDKAESAYHVQDYSSAARLFGALQQCNESPQYNHVAKLKHGESLWKAAERAPIPDEQKRAIINRSIELLRDATNHRDIRYAARSRYQLSKALWHLWRYEPQNRALVQDAIEEAKQAAELGYQLTYMSWYERLMQLGEGAVVGADLKT